MSTHEKLLHTYLRLYTPKRATLSDSKSTIEEVYCISQMT